MEEFINNDYYIKSVKGRTMNVTEQYEMTFDNNLYSNERVINNKLTAGYGTSVMTMTLSKLMKLGHKETKKL